MRTFEVGERVYVPLWDDMAEIVSITADARGTDFLVQRRNSDYSAIFCAYELEKEIEWTSLV